MRAMHAAGQRFAGYFAGCFAGSFAGSVARFVARYCAVGCVVALGLGTQTSVQAQVAISDSGTPSYSLPIKVPPGIAGMTPQIGLTYTASNVDGPVGYGWTVQGISAITRCPTNRATDASNIGVQYSAADKLCLDGQRLIRTDYLGNNANASNNNDSQGLSGTNWAEYRT